MRLSFHQPLGEPIPFHPSPPDTQVTITAEKARKKIPFVADRATLSFAPDIGEQHAKHLWNRFNGQRPDGTPEAARPIDLYMDLQGQAEADKLSQQAHPETKIKLNPPDETGWTFQVKGRKAAEAADSLAIVVSGSLRDIAPLLRRQPTPHSLSQVEAIIRAEIARQEDSERRGGIR